MALTAKCRIQESYLRICAGATDIRSCKGLRPSEKSFRRPEICAKKSCMISTQSKHENQAQDADGFVLIAIPIKPASFEMPAGQIFRFDKKRAHAAVAPQNIHIVAVAGGIELEQ